MAFTLEIKQGNTWQTVTAVYPLTIGELLDERLDEANVVFYSTVASYKPLTEVRITFENQGGTEHFILANDASAEYPAGSGKYKHEAYLIERTKLLEGILCQSLTFTNALPISSRPIGNRVYATTTTMAISSTDTIDMSDFTGYGAWYSPYPNNIPFVVPSVNEMGEALATAVDNKTAIWDIEYQDEEFSNAEVYVNGTLSTTASASTNSIILNNLNSGDTVNVRYFLRIDHRSSSSGPFLGWYYEVQYTINITDVKSLRPYSITDCINRVLELAEPIRRGERPRYVLDGAIYDVNGNLEPYEQDSNAEKYDKVRAPEFTLTQSTLREQLRAIGSYIHAEPYLEADGRISYLEYGNTKEEEIDAPYISNTASWSINNYCTEIRSNAQNLTSSLGYAKGAKIEPADGLYRSLRSEMQYQRINEQNTSATTDEPIYEIDKVLCGLANGENVIDGWVTINNVELSPKDITSYIVEATEYNSNLAQSGFFPYAKNWALYYTQGSRNIEGLFYQPPAAVDASGVPFAISNILAVVNGLQPRQVHDALTVGSFLGIDLTASDAVPANLVFQITYKPISSAFVSHGKQEYVTGEEPYTLVYNQSDNLVETEYYGENMKGVAARMGNIEKERTFILKSRTDIPRVGYMLDGYAISAVSCEYYPDYIKCMVGLTKDFNRISEYIGINSMKRMYEVSERQSQERQILIKETVLITDDADATSDSGVLLQDLSGVLDALNTQTYSGDAVARCAKVKTYKKNVTPISDDILLPIAARSFGNSVHFAFGFKDNFSAGTKTEWITDGDISGRWQTDVPYTDNYGRAYYLNFFIPKGFATSTDASIASIAFELPEGGNSPSSNGIIASVGGVNLLRVRKDNREIISINYELEYKTDVPDLIIGSALAARCRYINSFDTDNCVLRFMTASAPLNKFGRYLSADSLPTPISSNYFEVIGNELVLHFNSSGTWAYDTWAIISKPTTVTETYVDEDGNTVTETVEKGGEILLAGKIPPKPDGSNRLDKTFKFVIKK